MGLRVYTSDESPQVAPGATLCEPWWFSALLRTVLRGNPQPQEGLAYGPFPGGDVEGLGNILPFLTIQDVASCLKQH